MLLTPNSLSMSFLTQLQIGSSSLTQVVRLVEAPKFSIHKPGARVPVSHLDVTALQIYVVTLSQTKYA